MKDFILNIETLKQFSDLTPTPTIEHTTPKAKKNQSISKVIVRGTHKNLKLIAYMKRPQNSFLTLLISSKRPKMTLNWVNIENVR